MIVVDASVLVTALGDDGDDGDRARSRLRVEDRLIAPHLVDIEVVSAWRRMTAAGDLAERRAELAILDLRALRMDRVPHGPLLERCWQLRANLTAYDAVYVALAEIIRDRAADGRQQARHIPSVAVRGRTAQLILISGGRAGVRRSAHRPAARASLARMSFSSLPEPTPRSPGLPDRTEQRRQRRFRPEVSSPQSSRCWGFAFQEGIRALVPPTNQTLAGLPTCGSRDGYRAGVTD